MTARRTTSTGAALLVATLLLSGCGDDGEDPAGSDPGSGSGSGGATECTEANVGGELTMGVYSEAKGLDPTMTGGTGRTGDTELAAIYDTLMRFDAGSGTFVPQLAESLESPDGQTWTLTLREGITYGNGDPMTAADVQASIERTKTGINTTTRSLASTVTTMEVVDDLTLTMTLDSAFAGFPGVLAGGTGMIVNPRVVEAMSPEDFNVMPAGAGAGPYEPETFAPGEEIVLTAKTDYWGGPVCIETLRFVAIAGASATYDALRNDEVQVGFLREPIVIAQAKEDGYEGLSAFQNAGEALAMNSASGATSDPRVRLAVNLALNPTLIDDRANDGDGLPSPNLVYGDSRLFPGVDGLLSDPDAAADLVTEAKADGYDGTISLLCDTAPYRIEEAIVMEALLEAVGFEVELENNVVISDLVTRVLVDRNYELSCWGLNVTDENPWVGLDQFRSDSASNYAGYANDDVDAAIAALKVATTDAEISEALGQIQAAWNEDPAVAPLAAFENFIAFDDAVGGVTLSASTMVLFDQAYLIG